VAAAIAVKARRTPREIDPGQLRHRLRESGAILDLE
jgi:hypothetical protein